MPISFFLELMFKASFLGPERLTDLDRPDTREGGANLEDRIHLRPNVLRTSINESAKKEELH